MIPRSEHIRMEWIAMRAVLESIQHRQGEDVSLPDDLLAEVDGILGAIEDRMQEETMADLRRRFPSSE